ncbi:MAG: undecaprenyldiphospho-muramoylpentapeptide beta-N-acetylglucosaminyltransferase [Ignavibacteriae bacterium]|nr:undecaprenyldiphospho-muramoylpentapeptide beta-N-acetylglucosaminyltransferase [Ignavibacteriota bacterium]
MKNISNKYIFAAGGTGGHLYPAVAVAEHIRSVQPESTILFVGTKNKIESRVVPNLGFAFKTIWISGFSRKLTLKNLLFPIKLIVSIIQSMIINLNFNPSVAIGAGAYLSGPIVWLASVFGAKVVLLEQNSYPGVTNRMLQNKADKIHLGFEDSKKYFKDKSKLFVSGNPVRTTLKILNKEEALKKFSFSASRKTLLILGGSLGAKNINESVKENLQLLIKENIQIIWQTGELYFDSYKELENENVKVLKFIDDMSTAYSASDLVLARAGATTIAEVAYLGLPVIFVPSKNVAANHQFKNAKSIVDNNAGLLIEDDELVYKMKDVVLETIGDKSKLEILSSNIKKFSKPGAVKLIAEDIMELAKN